MKSLKVCSLIQLEPHSYPHLLGSNSYEFQVSVLGLAASVKEMKYKTCVFQKYNSSNLSELLEIPVAENIYYFRKANEFKKSYFQVAVLNTILFWKNF